MGRLFQLFIMTTGTVEERTETVSVTKEECIVIEKDSKLCGEGNLTNPVKPDIKESLMKKEIEATKMEKDNVIKEKVLKKVNENTGELMGKKESTGSDIKADDASVESNTEAKVKDITMDPSSTKTAAEPTKMKSVESTNKDTKLKNAALE